MAITDSAACPSLLSFLQPRVPGIALQFLNGSDSSGEEIFAYIENPGPFADLRPGQVAIDDTGLLADLFFLVQPDHYPAGITSELRPVSNSDVDNSWQQAFMRLHRPQAGMPPAWPSQIDEKGRLLPFCSLFYCRHTQVFCRPLCPSCGRPLALCRDDRMLHEAGLAGYGDSLQRYLYCPACHQASSQAPFYSKVPAADASPRERGCADLVQDFSRLLTQTDLADDLPCVGCEHAAQCYGPRPLVLERMRAVHFYPFFMLVQPAPSLNALDFAALLGDAGPDDIEQRLGRQQKNGRLDRFKKLRPALESGPGFLFASDARHFLELLYLKLTFLRELMVLVNQGASEPVNHMTMEGIWVRLAENSVHLPYLWNFSLQLVDPVGPPEFYSADSRLREAHLCGFLGTAWYYVLLVNAAQPMEAVQAGIEKLLGAEAGADSGDPASFDAVDALFEARNIFWRPPDFVPNPGWEALWQEALELGTDPLRAGLDAGEGWSRDDFTERLDGLRGRVHQALFEAPAAGIPAGEAPPATASTTEPAEDRAGAKNSNDPQIAALLTEILRQWGRPPQPGLEATLFIPPPGLQPDESGDYQETVILTAKDPQGRNDAASPPEPTPDAAGDLEKTMVLSPDSTTTMSDDLEKTAILSPASSPAGGDGPAPVISTRGPTPTDGDAPSTENATAEEDLEETVMLQPQQTQKRKPTS
jgi:hypothetical protein